MDSSLDSLLVNTSHMYLSSIVDILLTTLIVTNIISISQLLKNCNQESVRLTSNCAFTL